MSWTETLRLIPDGVQTMSKMPKRFVEGVYPKYLISGKGAIVTDENGKEYIDYTCGLGAIILGYGNESVNYAISQQMNRGFIFGLPNPLETDLAERIFGIFEYPVKMRFLKTGSEANSAAVRIARAYTGKQIILKCGYAGWHDWAACLCPHNKGIPPYGMTKEFKYNDIEEAEALFKKHKVAAVIIEPYVFDEPQNDFLLKLRKLCDEKKALLIFDEIVTGFRTKKYLAQNFFGVYPDITTLGKGMANGLPISVVAGKPEIMDILTDGCFVSSTFGGELLSISAAIQTLDTIKSLNVIDAIWRNGEVFQQAFNDMAKGFGECLGFPCRTYFKFPTEEHKSLFWQECLLAGTLFGYAQFISFAHDKGILDRTIEAMQRAVYVLKKYWEHPKDGLKGNVAEATFRLTENLKEGT